MQKKSSGIFPNYKDLSNKFFKYVGEPTAKVKNTIEEFYQISIEYFTLVICIKETKKK